MAVAYFNDEATANKVWEEIQKLDPKAEYSIGVNCPNPGFNWAIESPASDCGDYLVSDGKAEKLRHWRACL